MSSPASRRSQLAPAIVGLALVVAATLVGVGPQGDRVELAGLRLAPEAAGEAELGERVRLTVTGLEPSRPGEFYELWLLNSPEDLVSVGAFRVGADGRATVEFPLGPDPGRYRLLDVSVERDDGDPGHSSRSVLRSS